MASGRILDFSLLPARLRVRDRQLLVLDGKIARDSIPIDDIAVVVLSHPQITVSTSVFQELMEADAVVVHCDRASIPIGLTLPIGAHHESARRARLQIDASLDRPLMKQLWRQIVKEKIKNQARLLLTIFQDDAGLRDILKTVKSGDSDNRESVAAKKYWARLFYGVKFKRDYEGKDPINAALNYGYAILRAIVARAIVAGGFIPALGICHCNKYNAYALADDLIEPFRPVVDCAVYCLLDKEALKQELAPETKAKILAHITGRYLVNGFQETIFETATKAVESLVRVVKGESRELVFPFLLPLEPIDSFDVPIVRAKEAEREDAPKKKKKRKSPPPF